MLGIWILYFRDCFTAARVVKVAILVNGIGPFVVDIIIKRLFLHINGVNGMLVLKGSTRVTLLPQVPHRVNDSLWPRLAWLLYRASGSIWTTKGLLELILPELCLIQFIDRRTAFFC